MRTDVTTTLADYRGILHWNAYSCYVDGAFTSIPALDIELFIKDHPIPMRKPKISEITTVPTIDPFSQREIGAQGVFFGSPDLLTLALTGFIITPMSGTAWAPLSAAGAALGWNMTYGEIVDALISGHMNQTIGGANQRKDPAYYISPYGKQYGSPIISTWECNYTVNRRVEQFSATLFLEK